MNRFIGEWCADGHGVGASSALLVSAVSAKNSPASLHLLFRLTYFVALNETPFGRKIKFTRAVVKQEKRHAAFAPDGVPRRNGLCSIPIFLF